ncbi:MAG: hypothetical protein ACMXYD_05630 [Candidatus Woesearchaeota archaeon]
MSFLEKIGLKHTEKKTDLPPPPPMPGAPEDEQSSDVPTPPPSEEVKKDISDLPSRLPPMPSAQEEKPEPPKKEAELAKNIQEPPQKSPSLPEFTESSSPEEKKPEKGISREQLREAFSDVPPIKAQKPSSAPVGDDAVKNFAVDDFVLPGEQEEERSSQPEVKVAPPELYISVEKYNNIQQQVSDLKKQVSQAEKDMQNILSERDKEDENFAAFIQSLEDIQEDLIRIDEDLFS